MEQRSDSCTASAGYKEAFRKILVPSFPVFLLTASAIQFGMSLPFKDCKGIISGAVFLFVSVAVFAIILRNTASDKCNSSSRYIFYNNLQNSLPLRPGFNPFIYVFLISIIIFFSVSIYMSLFFENPGFNLEGKTVRAVITDVKYLRYNKQLLLDITGLKKNKETSEAMLRGLAFISSKTKINVGDNIDIDVKSGRVIYDEKNISSLTKARLMSGIHYIFYLKANNYKTLKKGNLRVKDYIRQGIENNISRLFSQETSSILKALYFGNKNYIDKKTIIHYKRAGVLHVLAASGLHVGIVASVPFLLLGFFRIHKNIIYIITLIILFFYLYITDMPVSLLRAFVMFFIFSIQKIFDLEVNAFNTLFLSGIIILLASPEELFSPGFQLSFGATFGIIFLNKPYRNVFKFLPASISSMLSLTLSAQVFVFPVIFYHMQEVNLAGIISNLIVVPAVGAALVASILNNIISIIPLNISVLFTLCTEYIFKFINFIVDTLSNTGGHFYVSVFPVFILLPYFFLILPLLPKFNNRKPAFLFVLTAYILSWFYLSVFRSNTVERILIYKKNNSRAVMYIEKGVLYLLGNIRNFEDASEINRFIQSANINDLKVFMPIADFINLKLFIYYKEKSGLWMLSV